MPTYFYIRLKNSAAAKFRFVEIVFFGFIFETQLKTVPTSFSAAAIFFAAGTKTCFVLFLEHLSKPLNVNLKLKKKAPLSNVTVEVEAALEAAFKHSLHD